MEQNQENKEPTEKEQLYLNELKLLQADFLNYQRRTQKEKLQWEEQAQNCILLKFLEIKDNFERAPELDEGMKIIYNQFMKVFGEFQIEEIECKEYNPECQEVIAIEDEFKVIQKGYKRNSIILRPAKVVIGGKNE